MGILHQISDRLQNWITPESSENEMLNLLKEYKSSIAEHSIPSKEDSERFGEITEEIRMYFEKLIPNYGTKPILNLKSNLDAVRYYYFNILGYKGLIKYCYSKISVKQIKNRELTEEMKVILAHVSDAQQNICYDTTTILIYLRICYDDLALIIRNTSEVNYPNAKKFPNSMSRLLGIDETTKVVKGNKWETQWKEYKNKKYCNRLYKLIVPSFTKILKMRDAIVHLQQQISIYMNNENYFFYTKITENQFHNLEEIEQQIKMIKTILQVVDIQYNLMKRNEKLPLQ